MVGSGKEKVIIVGAGIGGLAAGFWLEKAGFEVVIYEKSAVAGGRMKTVELEGCRFDVGASLMPSAFTDVLALANEAGFSELVEETKGNLSFLRDGEAHSLDMQRLGISLLKTEVISTVSKIKLAKVLAKSKLNSSKLTFENFGEAQSLDLESAAEYCRREISGEVLDYFLGPFLRAMYLHSPEKASVAELLWCMNNLLGSTFNFYGGIDMLPKKLADKLSVRFNHAVFSIRECDSEVEVSLQDSDGATLVEKADYCVVATDAHVLRSLCHDLLTKRQENYIDQLVYAKDAVVSLVLNTVPKHDAVLSMPPAKSDSPLCVAVQENTKSTGRVPEGKAVITCHFVEEWNEKYFNEDDDVLFEQCKFNLESFIPEVRNHVIAAHVERWSNTAVSYPVGGLKDLSDFISDVDRKSRIQYCGEYMSLTTVNTAVVSAKSVVGNIISLRQPSSST